jgi:alkylation response protein AidB-like acyl-CoA dehydrogenase
MRPAPAANASSQRKRTAADIARELVAALAPRGNETTDEDRFVAENFALLKASGLIEAGVPVELGGGDANVDELAEMLKILARHCGSTALAFSMHTHQVAVTAWRWRQQKAAAAESLLKRVVLERIVLISSGGSDWIPGSGTAEKVDGGYRITARKAFASGAPAGDLFLTSALVAAKTAGATTVLHFAVPMDSPHVKVLDTWRALGMRGSGSHDVVIDGYFVPEAAILVCRKGGEWHPLFHAIGTIAFPLIYAVYLGVAESARDIAIELAKRKQSEHQSLQIAGRMDTELTAARLAHQSMLAAARLNAPSAGSVNQVMIGRQLVERHAIATVDYALQLAGGAGFYRSNGLERRFRDIQGARYHPLQSGSQARYSGAMALGLPVDHIF